jgi:hypothetical protein
LDKILSEAHQLPFGDVLLEYLRLLKMLVRSRTQTVDNPATDLTADGNKQALAIFKSKADELEKQMLSKTYVLINHNKLGLLPFLRYL